MVQSKSLRCLLSSLLKARQTHCGQKKGDCTDLGGFSYLCPCCGLALPFLRCNELFRRETEKLYLEPCRTICSLKQFTEVQQALFRNGYIQPGALGDNKASV